MHSTYIHTYVCAVGARGLSLLLILHPIFTNPVNQVESVLVQPPGVLGGVTADGLKQLILILTIEGTLQHKIAEKTFIRTYVANTHSTASSGSYNVLVRM